MARSRWNGDDGTTHAEAWSARESRRVPVAFRSSTTSRPRRGRGKRRASHAAAPARPPMCNAGGRRGSLGRPNAGGFWGNKGVRSRLSVRTFGDARRVPNASSGGPRTRRTKEYIHHARTNARVPPHEHRLFGASRPTPRMCVSSAAARRRRKHHFSKKKHASRHASPPRWLFRGCTPPRSCTGTWRARRRPPPRRWRRSR